MQHHLTHHQTHKTMNYRAQLLSPDSGSGNGYARLGDHFKVLTYQQLAKFAQWSLETGKPVIELMDGWMIEVNQHESHMRGADVCFLDGVLPCGLYGGMDDTGRTHT